MNLKRRILFAMSIVTLGASPAIAATGAPRSHHSFGVQISLLDPYPSLLGLGLGYNLNPWLRGAFRAGTGLMTASYGVGLELFALPGSNLSPVVGANVTAVRDEDFVGTLFGSKQTVHYVNYAARVGFDWQADFGLNLQVGAMIRIANSAEGNVSYRAAYPYVDLGWFF